LRLRVDLPVVLLGFHPFTADRQPGDHSSEARGHGTRHSGGRTATRLIVLRIDHLQECVEILLIPGRHMSDSLSV
jgi:hypothetical protein